MFFCGVLSFELLQIHYGLDELPRFRNAVLTIGSFDGVHHGHRSIIKRLCQVATQTAGESIIVTFDPHPRKVVFPNDLDLRLLTTTSEKIDLLRETGLDHLIIVPFTVAFSQINPHEYVEKILIRKCRVRHLIIGYDHRFGLNRSGDIHLLRHYESQGAFEVEEIPQQVVEDLHVSSTKIRNHILAGHIPQANKLLGAQYHLSGTVEQGRQIAGALGYPTANCSIKDPDKILPAYGSYAAEAWCDGQQYQGMVYIGKSPTLTNRSVISVEINLFDKVEHSLYGKKIRIYPLSHIRRDQKYASKAELLYNIQNDKIESLQYLQSSKKTKLVTTAILNFNGSDLLSRFLPSHMAHSLGDSEVVVIDNASTDDSIRVCEQSFPDIVVTPLSTNKGYAQGYNEGLQTIATKYVALVNSDIEVTPGWLAPLLATMEADESVVAVQPKILSFDHKGQFEYAGAAGGFIDRMGYPYCRGRLIETVEQDQGQYDSAIHVDWTSGAAMLVRTEVFKAAGGFDSSFFAHMEEIDLCVRWQQAGYKMLCVPTSIVYHVGGATLQYQSPQKAFLNLRNNYHMLFKNRALRQLLYVIPIRIVLDGVFAIKELLAGRPSVAMAVMRGILSGLSRCASVGKQRKILKYYNNRYQRPSDTTERPFRVGILPVAYYIRGKKLFSQLPHHE